MEDSEIVVRTHSQTVFSLQDKIKQAISSFPYWEIEKESKAIEDHDSRASSELFLTNINEKIVNQPNLAPIVDEKEVNEATETTELNETEVKPEYEHFKSPLKMSIASQENDAKKDTNQAKGCCCCCVLF